MKGLESLRPSLNVRWSSVLRVSFSSFSSFQSRTRTRVRTHVCACTRASFIYVLINAVFPFGSRNVLKVVMSQEVVGPLGIAGAFSESLPVSPVEGGGINPALVYLAQLGTAVSRSTMASKLNRFAQWAGFPDLESCRWAMLTPESILAFLSVLEHEGRKSSTLNCYLASLKGVAKSAWLCKAMSHERYLRIAAIKQRRYYRLPAGRALTHEESRALLEDCEDDTPIGRRDALVLGLMLGCGLRRSEVASLRWDDYDQASSSFTVVGKGDKERRVFLPQAVRILLERYIVDVRGVKHGHLFGRMYKNSSSAPPLAQSQESSGQKLQTSSNCSDMKSASPERCC